MFFYAGSAGRIPKALLDSPSEPGRTVRTDTRLITRKGVVTPTVMVANWYTLNSGGVVASVALYGHSTLAKPDVASPVSTSTEFEIESYSAAPVAVLKLDGASLNTAKVMSANPAFAKMSGRQDVVGRTFGEMERFSEIIQQNIVFSSARLRIHRQIYHLMAR